jgi:hypothetical protein
LQRDAIPLARAAVRAGTSSQRCNRPVTATSAAVYAWRCGGVPRFRLQIDVGPNAPRSAQSSAIQEAVVIHESAVSRLRRGDAQTQADVLRLSDTVVPIPGASTASMRVLEFTIATMALAVAIILGFAR